MPDFGVIAADQLPGFRRRIRITPGAGCVQCELEDDFHCMSVIVHHDGRSAAAVTPDMRRAPWTTCPGAEAQLQRTFAGLALTEFANQRDKRKNCTHLFDLALLAAAHAQDEAPLIYDIVVSDPLEGKRRAQLRRNGDTVLDWTESGFDMVAPDTMKGLRLDQLRDWIMSLPSNQQEYARLLQWANMLANGRTIPLSKQSDATLMPPNCYSFQPERAIAARRVGAIKDFSNDDVQPLGGYRPLV